jgi:hypothetical protein
LSVGAFLLLRRWTSGFVLFCLHLIGWPTQITEGHLLYAKPSDLNANHT